jgi:hypothetical protein
LWGFFLVFFLFVISSHPPLWSMKTFIWYQCPSFTLTCFVTWHTSYSEDRAGECIFGYRLSGRFWICLWGVLDLFGAFDPFALEVITD